MPQIPIPAAKSSCLNQNCMSQLKNHCLPACALELDEEVPVRKGQAFRLQNRSNINESIVTESPVERQFIIFWLWPFWSKPRSNCFQKAAFKCSTCGVLDFSRTDTCGHGQTAQQPLMKTSHETYSTSVCICTESEQLPHTFILKRQQLAVQNPLVFNIKFAVYPTASSLSNNHSPYQQKTR